MEITPEEAEEMRDAARRLRKLSWGSIAWTFYIAHKPLELVVRSAAQDIVHTPMRHDTTYRIATDDLTLFCRDLLYAIKNVEKDYEKKAQLLGAASDLITLINKEEFMGGPIDPTPLFQRRYEAVRSVVAALHPEGFPMEALENKDAPRETLERARRVLRESALRLDGKSLRIENLLPLTTGFRTGDILIFEPLEVYCTGRKESAYFKKCLADIASGTIIEPVFYHGQA